MTVTEKKNARRAIEDLDLEARLARAGAATSRFAQEAVTRAGGFAQDHRETAHDWLGRAEGEVERVTGGRGREVVAKVRSGLAAGVDAVAAQGREAPEAEQGRDAPEAEHGPGEPPEGGTPPDGGGR